MTTTAYARLDERTPGPSPAAYRAADDLAAVREQWGDLLAAINRPPAAEWPPRDSRAHIDGHLAEQAADEEQLDEQSVGRMPLVLREHPAPLNLAALDAALDVETSLFDLADQVAEYAQRPVRTGHDAYGRSTRDEEDATDPARWHVTSYRDAGPADAVAHGSRAYGLHWAALWIAGRLLGEDTDGDLFAIVPARVLDQAAAVARRARRTVEQALGRDGRITLLADPCPVCEGELTAHTRAGGEPYVTCSTGETCEAPAPLDQGRRTWRGADLVALYVALDAARRRAAEA
ncbi:MULTISPECIES: hypothetical protein [Streptomyces]|uniref:hypothetical protein n=1 Tax=Streptomyces TaxID=1883 RepID=UPI000C26E4C4|nr:hypothetical protein [Streptomyces sp. CB02120-2]PJN19283.1 hypothetical protein CG724_11065 [Streptomyces sp. CB02120-2]